MMKHKRKPMIFVEVKTLQPNGVFKHVPCTAKNKVGYYMLYVMRLKIEKFIAFTLIPFVISAILAGFFVYGLMMSLYVAAK